MQNIIPTEQTSQTDWIALATAIIVNLAGIITAFAFLISVLKGRFDKLTELMNGHHNEIVEAVKISSETKGKVDALIGTASTSSTVVQPVIQPTTVIKDRREKEEKERKE